MDFPKDFDHRYWWVLIGIAGALVATASAPVKFVARFLIGLALLLFGVGQWIDHPLQTRVGASYVITSHPWCPTVLGCGLSLIGVILFGVGVYRLLAG